MRIIKLGIISIIVFFLLFTVISFFFPSHVRISKAIDIQTGKDSLMMQIADATKWRNWYPGADTLPVLFIGGKVKGIETGNRQRLIIKEINDSAVLTTHSTRGESGWNIFPGHSPNQFTVQWYMDFHLRWYPWEKFSSLLLEKRFGPMMEQGLERLKALLEK